MAPLGANKYTVASREADDRYYPVADSVHIYKGSLVNLHLGYAVPAADTASDVCVGIADNEADNTVAGHTAGGTSVLVRSGIVVLGLVAAGMAQTSVGATAMVTDSATVGLASTNSVHVGRIVGYNSATSVDVFIPKAGVGA